MKHSLPLKINQATASRLSAFHLSFDTSIYRASCCSTYPLHASTTMGKMAHAAGVLFEDPLKFQTTLKSRATDTASLIKPCTKCLSASATCLIRLNSPLTPEHIMACCCARASSKVEEGSANMRRWNNSQTWRPMARPTSAMPATPPATM